MGTNGFRGKTISGCCKDCTERYEACHDHCEKYKTAVAEWEEYKNKIKQAKKPTVIDEYRFESIRAMKKRRKWHDWKS